MREVEAFGRIRCVNGNRLVMNDPGRLSALRVGDEVGSSHIGEALVGGRCGLRIGTAKVVDVDASAGVVELDHAYAIQGLCDNDVLYRIEANDDLQAIEAYLLSCFRRRDWHGVADAANDLRVLEAVRAAKAGR